MGGTGRSLLTLSISSNIISHSLFSSYKHCSYPKLVFPLRVLQGFRPLCSSITTVESEQVLNPTREAFLEKLRLRHLKDGPKISELKNLTSKLASRSVGNGEIVEGSNKRLKKSYVSNFR